MTTYIRGDGVLFPDSSVQTTALGIKTFQQGYLQQNDGSGYTWSGEDYRYVDVTISSVNISKSFVYLQTSANFVDVASEGIVYEPTARLISNTVLRISAYYRFYVRWFVIEGV